MYVNDFLHQGRVKKVYVQADAPFRMNPEDLNLWYVRNDRDEMVPFSAFASGYWSYGSPRLERYNGNPAINIVGEAAPGLSSGDAMKTIGELVAQLPPGFGYEWTGASFQEMRAGTQAPFLYAISILVVFLCLAALYESWSVPFSVILAVPIGVLGALAAVYTRGLTNDVYFQVGLLTTIGLSAKNAILIVEFAKRRYDRGRDLVDSALRAARLAAAADPDDLAGLHARRAAAGDQHRRRRQQPSRHRHRRARRHDPRPRCWRFSSSRSFS